MDIDALAEDPGELADAIMDFMDALDAVVDERGFDGLPRSARLAYLALAADRAMNNAGPSELGEHGQGAVEALRTIGGGALADILERALAAADDPRALDEWSMKVGDLEVAIVEWVSSHADELRAL